MARGINKVILVGNLGQDPETRSFPDGGSVTNVSIATSESWKDRQTGQQQERTEWHRVVFRNRLAEIAAQYLRKGSKVYIEGSLRTRKWTNQQGQDQYTTEIIAREMQMLDSRSDNAGGYAPQQGGYQQQPAQQNYQQHPAPQASPHANVPHSSQYQTQAHQGHPTSAQNTHSAPPAGFNDNGFDDFDDDIPF